MSTKIKLTTAGVPLNGRRPAFPDLDHGTTIIEFARRGYTVGVRSAEAGPWYVSIAHMSGRAFSNQPEDSTETLLVKTMFWNDDARLTDDPWPEWVREIHRYIKLAAPGHMYVRTGIDLEGDTNG